MARLKSFVTTRKQLYLAFLCIPDNEFWKFRIDVGSLCRKKKFSATYQPKIFMLRQKKANKHYISHSVDVLLSAFLFHGASFVVVHRPLCVNIWTFSSSTQETLRNTQRISSNFGNIVSQSEGEHNFEFHDPYFPFPWAQRGGAKSIKTNVIFKNLLYSWTSSSQTIGMIVISFEPSTKLVKLVATCGDGLCWIDSENALFVFF